MYSRYNFNTSHVNVNRAKSSKQIVLKLISIHLMLMLIELSWTMAELQKHFNTSHVNVNRIVSHYIRSSRTNFNTSHVNVNQKKLRHIYHQKLYFNTSHVNVNLVSNSGGDRVS